MTDRLPRLAACQASASAPLVQAWTARLSSVPTLTTEPSAAISVLEDRTGDHALHALADGDIALALNEAQIRTAVTILGRDGLCAEPAAAVAAAGLMELKRLGRIGRDEVAVCIATASGVRWPATFAGLDGRPEQLGTG